MQVSYSTKYFSVVDEDAPSLMPDIPVKPSLADYLEGRNAAIEAALSAEIPGN